MRRVVPVPSLLLASFGALFGAVHCSSEAGDEGGLPSFSGSLEGMNATTPSVTATPEPGAAPSSPDPSATPSGEGNPTPSLDTPNAMGAANGGTSTPAPAAGDPEPAATPGAMPAPVDPAPVDPATGTDPDSAPAPTGPAIPEPPAAAFVERGNWRGFAFAQGVVQGTTLNPPTFEQRQPNQPFCLSGSVAPEPQFQGEALVGFTINQAPSSGVAGQGAPPLTAVPTGAGIAFSFSKSVGTILRVQLQPPDGAQPFCYEVPEAGGRAFAPYAEFNTACWDGSGQAYQGQPIESVRFQVPGDDTLATPYGFCINGFADGQGINNAPTDIPVVLTPIRGQLTSQFARAKVLAGTGESYIVQNNAWGATSSDNTQVIDFTGNGFTITRQSAGPNGNVPISFPSIFVGGNGFRGNNGSLTTRSDDRMPIRVGNIQSVQTRLRHNGGNGDHNVTYDVWFANQAPQGEYETAQAAFLMVWLFKPGGRNAIGFNGNAPTVNVDGRNWRLYVGDRNEASDGTGGNAPVISYVNEGAVIPDYQFDLNDFIRDAITRSQAGQLNGANFNANMFLTDIFGGFEIWGGGQGLRIDEFTAVVR
jgi:hypothetical protein